MEDSYFDRETRACHGKHRKSCSTPQSLTPKASGPADILQSYKSQLSLTHRDSTGHVHSPISIAQRTPATYLSARYMLNENGL